MLLFTQAATMLANMLNPAPPVADPKKGQASSTNTTAENFKTMRLLKRHYTTDALDRLWRIETRHCQYTGVIIRQSVRISD